MAALDRLAERELGAMEALFVMGDSEVHTRSTIVMLARLDHAIPFDVVVRAHERASRLVPHLRRRVIAPVLPISRPYWAVDPDFDLSYHVRRVRVPGEGNEQDLMALVEALGAAPVDVARPLWDVTSIEGLADGTGALVYKFHHAISDGQGAKEIFSSLFQLEPREPSEELPPIPAAEDLTRMDVTRQRINQLPLEAAYAGVAGARGLLSRGAGVLRHPRAAAEATVGYVQSLKRTMAPTADSSQLLQRRGIRRRFITLKVPLADLHRAARALHVSLNSAYVAGVVGGVTRYHEANAAAVAELAVAMPVSIRRPGDKAEENRFVAARIAAPSSGASPQERAKTINERVRSARDEPALEAMTTIAPVMSRLPLWLTVALAGNLATTDCQISNIAGYPYPVYLGDARIIGFHGFGPLAG
ncbi:MAG: wax ester/triacylglycerol synthase family O-acyltransferase, partial [Frankiales bacterium]|nr:wax ester/triacylglycerol synthase family O-acyltransferase [Frankiales bacterium]